MYLLYQVCFIVGLGYAVISFLLGHLLGFLDLGGDAGDLDLDLDLDADVELNLDAGADLSGLDADAGDIYPGGGVSPFKPVIFAAFLGVFGGIGMILSKNFIFYICFILSGTAGLAVSFLLYRFVYIPMYKAQNTSAVEKQSLIGKNAMVSEYIPQGGYGKITYHASGNTYTAPAKSESGDEIKRNADVVIAAIIKNTYYVIPKV